MNDRTDMTRVDNPYGALPAQSQQGGAMVLAEQQRAVAETLAAMQIARANPRNPIQAMQLIINDCSMGALAEESTYEYSRGGSAITGPSIRLAEAIARRWGNMKSGVVELARREGFSEVKAFAMDLETGYQDEKVFQVAHIRDTKQGGKALKDERDIYEHLANVAARRKRACILAIIPPDVVEAALKQCELTMTAKLDINDEFIKSLLESFAQIGVSKEMIEKRIQRKMEALTPALAIQLRRIRSSVKDGMSAPADWFDMGEPAAETGKPAGATAGVAGDLKEKAAKARKAAGTEGAPAATGAPDGATGTAPSPKAETVDPETGEIKNKDAKPPEPQIPTDDQLAAAVNSLNAATTVPELEAAADAAIKVGPWTAAQKGALNKAYNAKNQALQPGRM